MFANLKPPLDKTLSDHDDPVWSNVAYPLSVFGGGGLHYTTLEAE